ncbi:threonine--tRNA ligase [Candidatus Aerophobetes bacterium]|uniref:Threonine--tRNA ligase n=1 Tax=Aerophobetes bacterium TaxID=2030807 RepID=A0A497E374_UNCAE|nr:threonine--tRNA ligase [Candidatus Aerophobetes bacterium]RLE08845.1 MAG: threonine--tRNA ligase [Candidatus Aerophobetes bacterium]
MEEKENYSQDVLRHSASHIMAQAVKRLFPQAKLGIGPPIRDGFYYDFDIDGEVLSHNLDRIEEEMRKIVREDLPFEKEMVSKEKARKIFEEREEPYKLELLEEIEDDEVSLYRQGEFVDLCRGPHVRSTGEVKFFRLLSLAGAYWRGKEGNPMLSRIYGTAFFKKEDLDSYLNRIEEAKKRDHRKLGKSLDLFSLSSELGAGLVIYHPKGAILREILERFEKEEHLKRGYQPVITPHISRAHLWKQSGHLDYYRENMYVFSLGKEEYVVKPMNCPGHILVYNSKIRSYRDLPLRYFELGTVYRREDSGVLHGLLRVRGFTQDDAHIFCMPSQLVDEVREVLRFVLFMMKTFRLGYQMTLSTRPRKYIGSPENWERATQALTTALEKENIPFEVAQGEGAFYGPKIDVQMEDALGRLWQGPTIQVDFNLPERFDLTYIAPSGKKERVVMIHRVVLGTMERFIGILIEHWGGAFPVWLSPVQVRILTVTTKESLFAWQVYQKMMSEGIRVEVDDDNAMLGYKVRQAQLEKIPYMVIIGPREKEKEIITVRTRDGENLRGLEISEFIEMVKTKIEDKS